ncbi:MAG: hypothetical protein ACOCV2_02785 [Persicimonas sp.]
MNLLQNPLDGFSPAHYLATLNAVARSDGLVPVEEQLLEQHAARFDVDLNDLPEVPRDLSEVPWATRVLVYRDALMLAFADHDELSPEESDYLDQLAGRMDLPEDIASRILAWTRSYGDLLDELMELLEEP